jgi:hypothetical protein
MKALKYIDPIFGERTVCVCGDSPKKWIDCFFRANVPPDQAAIHLMDQFNRDIIINIVYFYLSESIIILKSGVSRNRDAMGYTLGLTGELLASLTISPPKGE